MHRVDVVQWCYTAAKLLGKGSVQFHPLNLMLSGHVFPSEWISTSMAGVIFIDPYTEVGHHVDISDLLWKVHDYHCPLQGRIALSPPWVP